MIRFGRAKSELRPEQLVPGEQPVAERLFYLLPTRYFRFFFLYDKRSHESCWIPEGFSQ